MMVQHGSRIGFSRGDVRLLTEDLQALSPTIFPTVPRLLNRIYDKVRHSSFFVSLIAFLSSAGDPGRLWQQDQVFPLPSGILTQNGSPPTVRTPFGISLSCLKNLYLCSAYPLKLLLFHF
jgi:hypothetical protein